MSAAQTFYIAFTLTFIKFLMPASAFGYLYFLYCFSLGLRGEAYNCFSHDGELIRLRFIDFLSAFTNITILLFVLASSYACREARASIVYD